LDVSNVLFVSKVFISLMNFKHRRLFAVTNGDECYRCSGCAMQTTAALSGILTNISTAVTRPDQTENGPRIHKIRLGHIRAKLRADDIPVPIESR
jgi:hypothetical protein